MLKNIPLIISDNDATAKITTWMNTRNIFDHEAKHKAIRTQTSPNLTKTTIKGHYQNYFPNFALQWPVLISVILLMTTTIAINCHRNSLSLFYRWLRLRRRFVVLCSCVRSTESSVDEEELLCPNPQSMKIRYLFEVLNP